MVFCMIGDEIVFSREFISDSQNLNVTLAINWGTNQCGTMRWSRASVRSAATRKKGAVLIDGDIGTLNIRYLPCHSRSLIIVHLRSS